MSFNHNDIEKKWQKNWDDNKTFEVKSDDSKPKFYALDMFPYPSGSGLHVGHPEGYTATDIISRYKRMNNFNVLHPMGWDAFGLPAEQYAIETGNHPKEFTKINIDTFKNQIKSLGFSYDWSREINTTDPKYYHWTQWIFIQLHKQGLAEVQEIEVNWCQALGTVLANEEILIVGGKMVSERGNHPVIKKAMKQWILKITEYAQRLLDDLEDLDWPESVKEMQRNWIGKSEGASVLFNIVDLDTKIEVFTTRPDTLFGVTYIVLAPEHILVNKIVKDEYSTLVSEYKELSKSKTDLERTELSKEKTGVFTGSYVVNPINGKHIPIWISDYVLSSYGTGAIMAVPAHDKRDYEFASKFDLEIFPVIEGDISETAYTKDGKHINSDFLNGLNNSEAISKIIEYLELNNLGKSKINFKLRDWIFARQRYWGEPFPVIYFDDGSIELVSENDLPLVLPDMDEFKPSGTGESPLANSKNWLRVVREDGIVGRRDTNTMPQWAGSCWYYIAYILKTKEGYLPLDSIDTQNEIAKWLPVDIYIGGAEHAVLHLLYARFWHKVLYDCKVVKEKEPFKRLFNQGMILGENGIKMSKSLGNVINPNDIVESHGADSLRLYEMFMGPLDQSKKWSTKGLDGARRFIDRVYRILSDCNNISSINDHKLDIVYNQTVYKVTNDFETLNFNTAISQMMIFINECYKNGTVYVDYALGFIKMFTCICPHVGSELWEINNQVEDINFSKWPVINESKLIADYVTIIVQINGKVRAKIETSRNTDEIEFKEIAFKHHNVKLHLENKSIIKEIFVINKLLNIVVK